MAQKEVGHVQSLRTNTINYHIHVQFATDNTKSYTCIGGMYIHVNEHSRKTHSRETW